MEDKTSLSIFSDCLQPKQCVCCALTGHILPKNASNFARSHLDLKNFPGENAHTPAYMGGGGEGKGEKGGEGRD